MTLPRTSTPRGRARSTGCSTAPLVQEKRVLADRYGSPSGGAAITPDGIARSGIGAESPFGIGLEIDRMWPASLTGQGVDDDQGVRDRLAGVGIGDSPVHGPGRLQRDRERLGDRGGVGLQLDHLHGESRVGDGQRDPEARAHAMQGEPAVGVGGRRLGPGRHVVPVGPPKGRALGARTLGVGVLMKDVADGPDRDLDAAHGLARDVEEPALDHPLGLEPDLGVGPIGVGIEVDPADAIAGSHRDGGELVITRRGRAGRIEPETARAVAARMADRVRAQRLQADGGPDRLGPRGGHHG